MSNTNHMLKNVEVEHLDAFEETIYNELSTRMTKTQALQTIIDYAEGDLSKLSDPLAEIAELQQENF